MNTKSTFILAMQFLICFSISAQNFLASSEESGAEPSGDDVTKSEIPKIKCDMVGGVTDLYVSPKDVGGHVSFGCDGESFGANSTSDGQANTKLIVEGCNEETFAAKVCDELEQGGYDDWYLPSLDELQCIYLNRPVLSGFASEGYWCSTEKSETQTWIHCNNGYKEGSKDWNGRLRCVRKD
jgi:hypothetical protein